MITIEQLKEIDQKNSVKPIGRRRIRSLLGCSEYEARFIKMALDHKDSLRTLLGAPVGGNVLVVGDLHAPFIKDGYLDFCYNMKREYSCTRVVFIGDLIDNHYSSYHEADPDGHSAGEELERAIAQISEWHRAFPYADVILGNHDNIPNRKAFSSGVSSRWIKSVGEVLETPGWSYSEELEIDGVLYVHGTGQKAKNRMKTNMMSVVQGHYHSESYIDNSVGVNHRIFCMQVGCGIDRKKYAFAYGRNFPKPHINCGVIVDGTPILKYMPL